MEFFRWILIATGVVLLVVAFLMGRNKTPEPVPRRKNFTKPVARVAPGDNQLPEPVEDPLYDDFSANPRAHESEALDASLEYGAENAGEPLERAHAVTNPDYVTETNHAGSFPTRTSAADDFEAIDMALDEESVELHADDRNAPKVTSFASAVKAANAQEDYLSSEVDDFDSKFYDDLEPYGESHNEPVQLEEFEEKLVSVHVVALSGRRFYGNDLKSLFDKHGYKFGRMSLYHCTLEGEKVFSIANMIKPGTFNEEQMRSFETPGITLFMRLPVDLDSDVAFDFLIQEAKELATELDGQLRDGNRNPLSEQTIQHMREDIQQYIFRTKRLLQPVT